MTGHNRENIRKILGELVSRKDASIFQDVEKFERLLREQAGSQGDPEIAALKAGLRELVPWDLRKVPEGQPFIPVIDKMAANLVKKYRFPDELALWALESWAISIGCKLEPRPIVKKAQEVSEGGPKEQPTPMGIIYGVDDRGFIRVFQVWWKPTFTGEVSGKFASTVRREIREAKPLTFASNDGIGPDLQPPQIKPQKQTGTNKGKSAPDAPLQARHLGVSQPQVAPQVQAKPVNLPKHEGPFFHFQKPTSAGASQGTKPASPKPPSAPIQPAAPKTFSSKAEELYDQGLSFLNGTVGKVNVAEAVRSFQQSAKLGYNLAAYKIGEIYLKGTSVKEDLSVALAWFQSAANKGCPEAQTQLGIMYQCGMGVPADLNEAKKWLKMAADQGNSEAKTLLNQIG